MATRPAIPPSIPSSSRPPMARPRRRAALHKLKETRERDFRTHPLTPSPTFLLGGALFWEVLDTKKRNRNIIDKAVNRRVNDENRMQHFTSCRRGVKPVLNGRVRIELLFGSRTFYFKALAFPYNPYSLQTIVNKTRQKCNLRIFVLTGH